MTIADMIESALTGCPVAVDFKAVADPLSCERPAVPLKAVLANCVAFEVVIAAVGVVVADDVVVPPPPPPPQPESAAATLIASKVLNMDGVLTDGMEWSRQ